MRYVRIEEFSVDVIFLEVGWNEEKIQRRIIIIAVKEKNDFFITMY